MNGHLKLYLYMFERSQRKHNNLDCHKSFWNIFPLVTKFICSKIDTNQTNFFACSNHSNFESAKSLIFFQKFSFSTKCAPFFFKIRKDYNIDD